MNFKNFLLIGALAALMVSCSQSFKTKSPIVTNADSVSYIYGGYVGLQHKQGYSSVGFDTLFNYNVFFDAFYNSCYHKKLKYELDSANNRYLDEFCVLIDVYNQRTATDTTDDVPPLTFSKSRLDSVSYLMGVYNGERFRQSFDESGLDTLGGLKFELFYEGYRETMQEPKTRIDIEKNLHIVQECFDAIQEREMLKQFGDIKREGEEFLARNKANGDVVTTESGLQYTIIKEGNGPKPVMYDRVKVHYTGTFLDGTVFDSSVERGEPAEFYVGGVIEGWNEALMLMPVGSKWKLFVPQELAYGVQGRAPRIKPYTMLIFEVELLDIVK